jgi:lipase ATG15
MCCKSCFEKSLKYKLNYFVIGKQILHDVNRLIDFNNSKVILTGHSLGGALATMLGLVFDKTAVSFESPGERNYMEKAGISYKKSAEQNIFHIGHNADIIFTGKCNGRLSWCRTGGYFINTKCHLGKVCEYDTINKLGMSESIFTHKIQFVIDSVITQWNDTIPSCKQSHDCQDCAKWTYL